MIAAPPTPVIAAVIARARRKIISHFFAMHAVSAADAVAYKPGRPIEARQFERMRAKGIVREAAPGTYWVDVAAYDADKERRRRILVPILIAVVVMFAMAITLAYKG
jgi:hypothetical protein